MNTDPKRELLRHAIATLAYRSAQVLRDAPPEFADFAGTGKTPTQILSHMSDVLEWALTLVEGNQQWRSTTELLGWPREVDRFFASMAKLDAYLASDAPLHAAPEKLLQAPIADALTHTGQLAMMRRIAGCAMKGQNYFVADIEIGRLGIEQSKGAQEF